MLLYFFSSKDRTRESEQERSEVNEVKKKVIQHMERARYAVSRSALSVQEKESVSKKKKNWKRETKQSWHGFPLFLSPNFLFFSSVFISYTFLHKAKKNVLQSTNVILTS